LRFQIVYGLSSALELRHVDMSLPKTASISRRHAIEMLFGLGVASVFAGCVPAKDDSAPPLPLPAQIPSSEVSASVAHADDVAALCDVLLPTERNDEGAVLSPGASEVDVDGVLRIEDFVAVATAEGLLPPLPDTAIVRLSGVAEAFRVAANAELGWLAARHKPLTTFRDLPRALQEQIVVDALDDDTLRPFLLVIRAACFLAFLGAVTNDLGLRAVGFPPFENFKEGVAVSGYPRTKSGRLIDITKEDLATLAAKGDLDDYTYNREPTPTSGAPLAAILDTSGDLL
jgi:hypothetical protein